MGEVSIRCYGEDESVAGLDGQKVAELNAELEWPRAQGRRGRFSLVTEEAMQSYLMRNNPIEATPEGCIAVLEAPL